MKKKHWSTILIEYILITVGCALMAVSIDLFLAPHTIAPGGVTGLAIVIKKITGISVSVTNLVINVPLFIAGVIVLGKAFGAKTGYATLALSFFIELVSKASQGYIPTNDMLLSTIYGGLITGVGIGLVFKSGGTTGGTDLAGAMLNKYFPNISIPKLMMCIDLCIVALAGFVNKNVETSLYSIIALYILVKMADFIIEGMGYSKAFFVISSKPDEISDEIMQNLGRGVTSLNGKGMYTKEEKNILWVVVDRTQEVKLKDIVKDVDENAFIMVANVHEVLGEGFKPMRS
ncbi:YitT family protein [Tepidibacter hydrothermalis]|uniref:YitT family protein n=1 Tax=Tepidibacter hydrothermalis TaxID=3036126 RepID=A0ABY8ECH9_9FIRM|nr:YitT family protein [Tepidibacter hydrothermalis]WFD10640.1 YitT family protein [Tepidibacter hydrothermalis]